MSLYAFKPQFQALLRPSVRRLHGLGVTANQVTVGTCGLSIALGLWLACNPGRFELFLTLPAWFFLRMALNAMDGMLAREFSQSSTLGTYLNELADVVSDAALYLPFAFVPGSSIALVGAVIFLSSLSEMAGVLGYHGGTGRRHDGPMGKSDRAFVFGAAGLLLGAGVAPGAWLSGGLSLVAVLLMVTIANRVRHGIAKRSDTPYRQSARPWMRAAQEKQFITHDGTVLFYRYWPKAGDGAIDRAIVLFHRGHEHSGRLQHVVDELSLDDFAMFAWDARGHGRSPGARGDSPSFAASVKDVDTFIRHVAAEYGIVPGNIAVIGQSVGAVLAATWAHDYAPRVRCLVLTAPAFKVKLYVPFARPGLALIRRLSGNFFINSYVKAKFLTHDPERIRSYEQDPLITRAISARVLLGLFDAAERVVADAQAIRLPLQLLVSDTDFVVHRGPQDRFFERLGSAVKERHLLPGFFHDTLGERDRKLALDKVRDFIERMFRAAPPAESLLDAHRAGHTRDEEIRLGESLPVFSPRNLRFAITRLSMRTLGRLSEGIRLGLATGFDSGSSLDYVYRNQARGDLVVGTVIDRGYLDAVGWRGIRVRKTHLVAAIAAAARRLRAAGAPVRVADIAAGHGRYVLEAVEHLEARPQSIVLRDYSEANVRDGMKLIADKQLGDIARFEQADAFDEAAVAALTPRPTLAIVSGLYELFSDNDLVARSLRGLARAVEPGGYLIYTGQPWHPQLELIARTLTSHRGQRAWVMRRRIQAEMDELARAAGFDKLEQWTGDSGIFTVSLARRV